MSVSKFDIATFRERAALARAENHEAPVVHLTDGEFASLLEYAETRGSKVAARLRDEKKLGAIRVEVGVDPAIVGLGRQFDVVDTATGKKGLVEVKGDSEDYIGHLPNSFAPSSEVA